MENSTSIHVYHFVDPNENVWKKNLKTKFFHETLVTPALITT